MDAEKCSNCPEDGTIRIKRGPCDIAPTIADQLIQPRLKKFPATKFGEEWRHFHSEWFKQYPWLEYSVLENACYCFPCQFFSPEDNTSPFCTTSFQNWKRAMEKSSGIKGHVSSQTHITASRKWDSFKNSLKNQSVAVQLNDAHQSLIQENRYNISALAEILLLTANQNVFQRGHDESKRSTNKGNFLELLDFAAKRDERLKKKLILFLEMQSICIMLYKMNFSQL